MGEGEADVVRHCHAAAARPFIFRLPGGEGVRVEAADDCPKIPVVAEDDVFDEGGRGLLLAEAATDKRGVEARRDGGGQAVWFACRAAADPVTPQAPPAPRP